jgi:hypothetical protein
MLLIPISVPVPVLSRVSVNQQFMDLHSLQFTVAETKSSQSTVSAPFLW